MQTQTLWTSKAELPVKSAGVAVRPPERMVPSAFPRVGNQTLGRIIQAKLRIGEPGDHYEQEADRVADQVMTGIAPSNVGVRSGASGVQRKCACGGGEGCSECGQEHMVQTKSNSQGSNHARTAHAHVDSAITGGSRLPGGIQSFFETKFRHSFDGVRVHTNAAAETSAATLGARAYTTGRDIVFGAGQCQPGEAEGVRLLAHELTHVVQQSAAAERPMLQRQLITPLAPGGGFQGLMERDRVAAGLMGPHTPLTSIRVCSRPLQSALGAVFDHAFIDAPPARYAVITPTCTPTDGGWNNPLLGTVAQKWDNSPDPCGKTPVRCVPCNPKPGVTDVGVCLRNVFHAYNNPSLYKALGPNSNTFAGTLARACCDGMVPKPAGIGNVPGWPDSPAPHRAGICPAGPSCT